MKTNFTFIVILLSVSMSISAQEISCGAAYLDKEVLSDTTARAIVESIDLIDDYYKNASFLNHTYDYETTNKIKYLKMQARNVLVLGLTVELGLSVVAATLFPEDDRYLWVCIPVETFIIMGMTYSLILWSNSLMKKAKAIEEHSIYIHKINDNIDLGVTHYINKSDRSEKTLGLALRIKL